MSPPPSSTQQPVMTTAKTRRCRVCMSSPPRWRSTERQILLRRRYGHTQQSACLRQKARYNNGASANNSVFHTSLLLKLLHCSPTPSTPPVSCRLSAVVRQLAAIVVALTNATIADNAPRRHYDEPPIFSFGAITTTAPTTQTMTITIAAHLVGCPGWTRPAAWNRSLMGHDFPLPLIESVLVHVVQPHRPIVPSKDQERLADVIDRRHVAARQRSGRTTHRLAVREALLPDRLMAGALSRRREQIGGISTKKPLRPLHNRSTHHLLTTHLPPQAPNSTTHNASFLLPFVPHPSNRLGCVHPPPPLPPLPFLRRIAAAARTRSALRGGRLCFRPASTSR